MSGIETFTSWIVIYNESLSDRNHVTCTFSELLVRKMYTHDFCCTEGTSVCRSDNFYNFIASSY